jgi:hypothetical protein
LVSEVDDENTVISDENNDMKEIENESTIGNSDDEEENMSDIEEKKNTRPNLRFLNSNTISTRKDSNVFTNLSTGNHYFFYK